MFIQDLFLSGVAFACCVDVTACRLQKWLCLLGGGGGYRM
jgi:hypothetical protein